MKENEKNDNIEKFCPDETCDFVTKDKSFMFCPKHKLRLLRVRAKNKSNNGHPRPPHLRLVRFSKNGKKVKGGLKKKKIL